MRRLLTEDQICPKSFVWQKRRTTKFGIQNSQNQKVLYVNKRSDYFSIPPNLDHITQMAYIIDPKTVRNTTLIADT